MNRRKFRNKNISIKRYIPSLTITIERTQFPTICTWIFIFWHIKSSFKIKNAFTTVFDSQTIIKKMTNFRLVSVCLLSVIFKSTNSNNPYVIEYQQYNPTLKEIFFNVSRLFCYIVNFALSVFLVTRKSTDVHRHYPSEEDGWFHRARNPQNWQKYKYQC